MVEDLQLTTTHGLPLELILQYFRERSMVVDWADYVAYCLKDGHNPDTIRSRIETAIADVYGPQYKQEVLAKLDLIF
jgi:alanyl-tRNA synthetase